METEKITINNKMGIQQQELEEIDTLKGKLLAQRDENTKQKSKKTTETGKMLMTIENLYNKCYKERHDMITYMANVKAFDKVKYFDEPNKSGEKAVEQLKVII